jgi:hypothetical protein
MKSWLAVLVLAIAAFPQQPVVASANTPDINLLLAQIDASSQATSGAVQQLRIDKWKTESDYKQQSQANAQSILNNLGNALPGMLQAVRTGPQDLSANFKLYRNLSALYDVLQQLTESAGAFGKKEEFQALGTQLQAFDQYRRQLGDYFEQLAAQAQTQLSRKAIPAASGTSSTPKHVIVDDTSPSKSPKKRSKKKSAATQSSPQ